MARICDLCHEIIEVPEIKRGARTGLFLIPSVAEIKAMEVRQSMITIIFPIGSDVCVSCHQRLESVLHEEYSRMAQEKSGVKKASKKKAVEA